MIRSMTCLVLAALSVGHLSGTDEPAKAKPSPIKVSKETTYILEPLDSEGYVDYVEAVNQRASKEVTAATNYEVIVRAVLGPRSISPEIRQEYFERLGVKEPAEIGQYFQDFISFHTTQKNVKPEEVVEEHGLLMSQPWTGKEHPRGAAWLQAMAPFLDQIVDGTRRPRMYVPYVGGTDRTQPRMIAVLLPTIQDQRELARSLMIRAYSRMDAGDFDGAWSDLQGIHRQARLVSQGFSVIELLVGIALESIACDADANFLQSGKLTAVQLRRYLGDLNTLPPLPPVSEVIDKGERFSSLDFVQVLARSKDKSLKSLLNSDTSAIEGMMVLPIDWNVTMETFNKEYDRIGEVFREPDPGLRMQKVAEHDAAFKKRVARAKDPVSLATGALLGSAKSRGQTMAEVLLALLMPAFRQMDVAATRGQARLAITRVAFGLELFRLEHGQYPESLDALSPTILKTVPPDPFTGKPLIFRRDEATGFIVYSLGDNRTDDGGRTVHEPAGETKADDLAVTGRPRKKN